jgi:hypothetical protein
MELVVQTLGSSGAGNSLQRELLVESSALNVVLRKQYGTVL